MKKSLVGLLILFVILMTACGKVVVEEKPEIQIGVLKGPSAVSILKLMEDGMYNIEIYNKPEELNAAIVKNEVDIAALPTNMASIVYGRTNHATKILVASTMGSLYVIANKDVEIKTLLDLKTVGLGVAGKGATPDLVLQYFVGENENVSYYGEHTELASLVTIGRVEAALLPEPFVTIALTNNPDLEIKLDLNQEWIDKNEEELPMGVLVANAKGIEAAPVFLQDYKKSIDYVTEHTDEVAKLAVKYEIVNSEKIALEMIPRTNIKFITGNEMKKMITSYFEKLFALNPASIGGTLPDETIFY